MFLDVLILPEWICVLPEDVILFFSPFLWYCTFLIRGLTLVYNFLKIVKINYTLICVSKLDLVRAQLSLRCRLDEYVGSACAVRAASCAVPLSRQSYKVPPALTYGVHTTSMLVQLFLYYPPQWGVRRLITKEDKRISPQN